MKFASKFLFCYFLSFLSCNAVYAADYKSVIVVGHLFTLYEIHENGGAYLDKDNLSVLTKRITAIPRVKRVVLLGDTYVDDRDEVYRLVKNKLTSLLTMPVTKVYANHEVDNLVKFKKSGGGGSTIISYEDVNFLVYTPWRYENKNRLMKITDSDVEFFNSNLSSTKKNIVLITDMPHHKNSGLSRWFSDIVPLLKKNNVKYVVVGDNDRTEHRYHWVELDGIKYISQGVAHNFYVPNINTFLEIQIYKNGKIKFKPHAILYDGLSNVYRSNKVPFINKKKNNQEACSYSAEHGFSQSWLDKIKCKILQIAN